MHTVARIVLWQFIAWQDDPKTPWRHDKSTAWVFRLIGLLFDAGVAVALWFILFPPEPSLNELGVLEYTVDMGDVLLGIIGGVVTYLCIGILTVLNWTDTRTYK